MKRTAIEASACVQAGGGGGAASVEALPLGQVCLNVGGVHYMTTRGTLTKMPDSMLGRMFASDCKEAAALSSFIDRNGHLFEWVLDAHRDGVCRYPSDVVESERVHAEYVYFGLVEPTVPSPAMVDKVLTENNRVVTEKEQWQLTCVVSVADLRTIQTYVQQFADEMYVTSIRPDRIVIQYRKQNLALPFTLMAKQCFAFRHVSDVPTTVVWRFLWWRQLVNAIKPGIASTDMVKLEFVSHNCDSPQYEPICCRMTVYDDECYPTHRFYPRCKYCTVPM